MKKVVFVLALLIAFGCAPALVGARGQAGKPKLVVVIVVDQMRGDYPVRYASLLEHGLKRLTTQGAWYRNAAYPYLSTVTCAGHSTIGTGTLPWHHGMIANGWLDRETQRVVTCNADPSTAEVSYAAFSGPATVRSR
jgi:predicted AlkP superfamily pyrophosphatase or phosphodiesterase